MNGPQSEQLLELLLPQLKQLHLYSLMFSSIAERVGRRAGPKLDLVDMKCKGVAPNVRLRDVSQRLAPYKKFFVLSLLCQVHTPLQTFYYSDCQLPLRESG